jgi:thiol-disulfide isomerase/thioredoxin
VTVERRREARGGVRRRVGPFSLRQVTIAIIAVMATAIALTVATVPIGSSGSQLPVPEPSAFLLGSPIPGLAVGEVAPELAVDRDGQHLQLMDLDGKPIRLADLRGKVVWVNFWASWCPPCQFETPTLRALDQRYRDRGLRIVAIQVQQTVQAGLDYATRYGLGYTIGADVTGDFFHLYRGFALPTQFFLDAEGRVRQIVNGPMLEDRAIAIIEGLLPAGAVPASPGGSPVQSTPPGS